jgi:hypothetical protein
MKKKNFWQRYFSIMLVTGLMVLFNLASAITAYSPVVKLEAGSGEINLRDLSSTGLENNKYSKGVDPMKAIASGSWEYSQEAGVGPTSVRSPEGRAAFRGESGVESGWVGAQSLPVGDGVVRYGHAQCAEEPESFYVISGVNQSFTVTNKAWRYDVIADQWVQLADIPAGKEGLSAACYEGYLYALGGGGTNQFYIYDISADAWAAGPLLPRNVWGAAVGVYDGFIYMVGGDNDFSFGGTSNQVDIYDIGAGVWVGTGAPMPTRAVTAGFAQAGEFLYVVGGWGDTSPGTNVNQTQRYDMASDTWELGPEFTSARGDLPLAITGSHLYAVGGDANGGGAFDATSVVERLDHTAFPGGSWEAGVSLPSAITAHKGGFCTEMKSGGEVWSAGGYTGAAIVGTNQNLPAEGCLFASIDVDWLSQDPEAGQVENYSSLEVGVTFSALPYMEPDVYNAWLLLFSNDSFNHRLKIPIHLTVVEPLYNVEVSPDQDLFGSPGEEMVIHVSIVNTGNGTDTFSIELAGAIWPASLSANSITLAPGQQGTVELKILIPENTVRGEWVLVTFKAVSQGDAEITASSSIRITVVSELLEIFLPVVVRKP